VKCDSFIRQLWYISVINLFQNRRKFSVGIGKIYISILNFGWMLTNLLWPLLKTEIRKPGILVQSKGLQTCPLDFE